MNKRMDGHLSVLSMVVNRNIPASAVGQNAAFQLIGTLMSEAVQEDVSFS
jgi:hypothetical protein